MNVGISTKSEINLKFLFFNPNIYDINLKRIDINQSSCWRKKIFLSIL